ncbi:MAG: glycoside hydrolase family 3 N-terminal domain-containing protein [Pseudomonadota bacterium]
MPRHAMIVGLSGTDLTEEEARFLAAHPPWGLILFARNVDTPERLKTLVADARRAIGAQVPVLIDQEGGRVARLRPPQWLDWPRLIDTLSALPPEDAAEAAALRFRLIGNELIALGVDVDCMPMLDVPRPASHDIITDRVMGRDAVEIARIGQIAADALKASGVLPVIKHIPGHGLATVDSHLDLPRVSARLDELAAVDFMPFRALNGEAMAMTAHIVYDAIDSTVPATLSPAAIAHIRETIGFDGLLMTDDISMKALKGPVATDAMRALDAGCDIVLHCNGDMAEMVALAEVVPRLTGRALDRAAAAEAARPAPEPFDRETALRQYRALVGEASAATKGGPGV